MANQLQLLVYEGHLTADPESRFTDSGKLVTNFKMASNRSYKGKNGEKIEEVTYFKVVVWGEYGKVITEYCAKGSHVVVTGRIRPGKNGNPDIFDLRDGGHGASYEIVANDVRIIKGKSGSKETEAEIPAEDEIPF